MKYFYGGCKSSRIIDILNYHHVGREQGTTFFHRDGTEDPDSTVNITSSHSSKLPRSESVCDPPDMTFIRHVNFTCSPQSETTSPGKRVRIRIPPNVLNEEY